MELAEIPPRYGWCMKAILVAIALLPLAGFSQDPTPVKNAPPAAKAEDVGSVDSIVKAVYGVISGPAGKKRDWDRMRSLFLPDAKMMISARRRAGEMVFRPLTVEDYIKGSAPLLEEQGFFEREVARRTEQFANIAHVFSTYESRHKAEDENPFARGINSIQLWNDGKRWWVVSIYWQGEDPTNPLPDKYLKGG
jgi:hypothetical protein